MKQCTKCNEVKSFDNFWKDRTKPSGHKSCCKLCQPDRSEYHKTWQEKKIQENPNYWKEREINRDPVKRQTRDEKTRLKKYGLTEQTYQVLFDLQNGTCAICKRESSGRVLAVDHDHKCCAERSRSCGRCIRGLLCVTCNQALGMFLDSEEVLLSAINYLKESSMVS